MCPRAKAAAPVARRRWRGAALAPAKVRAGDGNAAPPAAENRRSRAGNRWVSRGNRCPRNTDVRLPGRRVPTRATRLPGLRATGGPVATAGPVRDASGRPPSNIRNCRSSLPPWWRRQRIRRPSARTASTPRWPPLAAPHGPARVPWSGPRCPTGATARVRRAAVLAKGWARRARQGCVWGRQKATAGTT